MKYFNRKVILAYLYDQLTGNFMGFLIGLSATGLISQFFETRGINNLWGLTSRKTVIDKETFSNLEWAISILVGFIVFEIMTKVVKEKIDTYFPVCRYKILRWLVNNNWHKRFKQYNIGFKSKRMILFTGVHYAVRNTFSKYSRR